MTGLGKRLVESWKVLKESPGFRNVLTFLIFVVIATIFWLVMALNDNVQKSVTFRLDIENVPDSVTFINIPPSEMHVVVRDKGTSLLRLTGFHHPTLHFNFNDFSHDGVFRLTGRDIQAAMKPSFGSSATILSNSLDSLRLHYTTGKGKMVPIVVVENVSTAPGHVAGKTPETNISRVTVYGDRQILDTLTRVFTRPIVKTNLSEPTTVEVALQTIPGVRIEPAKVKVKIPVEPLVAKTFYATVVAQDVPEGESLILFPSKVKVSCFVPMSRFGIQDPDVKAFVTYNDLKEGSSHLQVHLMVASKGVVNPTLETDSVEYTLVK
ncbi:MAG: hypothetical protein K2G11_06045 [Muribaculaceae bacterium]|nr:hypothetical protein [Muribaculaceae bacterium]